MKDPSINVLALVPNLRRTTPGQRSSIEAWEPFLHAAGIRISFLEFETPELREVLYTRGNTSVKARRLFAAYVRRLRSLSEVRHADLIYVYREAALVGPGFIEWILRALGKPYIYAIDDPIFVPYVSPYQGGFTWMKFPTKIKRIVQGAEATFANSRPILAWASQYSSNVFLVPSAVDTEVIKPRSSPRRTNGVVIGWSGSGSTASNLSLISQALLEVQKATGVEINLMGAEHYPIPPELKTQQFQWTETEESRVVSRFDIGVAPMPLNKWNHWKFSGKVTYFMALGIPTVASPLGDIPSQLRHGVDGFLAESDYEWIGYLSELVADEDLRTEMGINARDRACRLFSTEVVAEHVAGVIHDVFRRSHNRD